MSRGSGQVQRCRMYPADISVGEPPQCQEELWTVKSSSLCARITKVAVKNKSEWKLILGVKDRRCSLSSCCKFHHQGMDNTYVVMKYIVLVLINCQSFALAFDYLC